MQKTYNYFGWLAYTLSISAIGIWMRARRSRRVRVIVFNKKGQLLLVRNWFGPQDWSLPGGGCKYLEADQTAAVRELHEETNLKINPKKLKFVHEYKHPKLHYQAAAYTIHLSNNPSAGPANRRSRLEIIDCDWFDLDNLPEVNPQVKRTLGQLQRLAK
jgi:ADP-ribose pyrophosphatase YjhB (NUDIX family)